MWVNSEAEMRELILGYEGYRFDIDGDLEIGEVTTLVSTVVERLKREHIIKSSSAMKGFYILKETTTERKIAVKDMIHEVAHQRVINLTDFFIAKEQTKIYMIFDEEEILDEMMFNCEMPMLLVNCLTFRELAREIRAREPRLEQEE